MRACVGQRTAPKRAPKRQQLTNEWVSRISAKWKALKHVLPRQGPRKERGPFYRWPFRRSRIRFSSAPRHNIPRIVQAQEQEISGTSSQIRRQAWLTLSGNSKKVNYEIVLSAERCIKSYEIQRFPFGMGLTWHTSYPGGVLHPNEGTHTFQ